MSLTLDQESNSKFIANLNLYFHKNGKNLFKIQEFNFSQFWLMEVLSDIRVFFCGFVKYTMSIVLFLVWKDL